MWLHTFTESTAKLRKCLCRKTFISLLTCRCTPCSCCCTLKWPGPTVSPHIIRRFNALVFFFRPDTALLRAHSHILSSSRYRLDCGLPLYVSSFVLLFTDHCIHFFRLSSKISHCFFPFLSVQVSCIITIYRPSLDIYFVGTKPQNIHPAPSKPQIPSTLMEKMMNFLTQSLNLRSPQGRMRLSVPLTFY